MGRVAAWAKRTLGVDQEPIQSVSAHAGGLAGPL